jgi:prevent-host-death family protein
MTTAMGVEMVSKSRFKAKALEYFREVERSGSEIVITDHGRPVLKLVRYRADAEPPESSLRDTVRRYDDPTLPVAEEEWESLG